MEGFDFNAWLKAMRFTKAEAARALGVSQDYVSMLTAKAGTKRHRPISSALVLRCGEVARQRITEILPYTEIGQGAVFVPSQYVQANVRRL